MQQQSNVGAREYELCLYHLLHISLGCAAHHKLMI